MPAIKGDMYINTHCNYSQPTLIKLDNENIGGHLTPLQAEMSWEVDEVNQDKNGEADGMNLEVDSKDEVMHN